MRKLMFATLLCFVSALFTAMTCDDSNIESVTVTFENKSGDSLYVDDFMFMDDTTFLSPYHVFVLMPYPIEYVPQNGFYEQQANLRMLEQGYKFQLIVFKKGTLDRYSKDELVEGNIFDKRYVLSYDELKVTDFKIVYTGD